MRSLMGEPCFAAHARHAEIEMRTLGHDILARISDQQAVSELRQLLGTESSNT